MQVDSSEEEIEIRVRYPEEDRVISTIDDMRVRTEDGLVPLSNFITRQPVPKLAEISRYNGTRYFLVRADVNEGVNANEEVAATEAWLGLHDALPNEITPEGLPDWLADVKTRPDTPTFNRLVSWFAASDIVTVEDGAQAPDYAEVLVSGEEDAGIIAGLETFLAETEQLPASVTYEFAGDQEEQAESMAFLGQAFIGALGLMFVILLAQFNSFYNSIIVLVAVVLSVTGVLIGMLILDQTFSVIMTGTGIVALAGIVVNNNIVLIDTYQDYSRYMPRTEAITRTAEARIRPVLLTTITTMAGLTPMMFGVSVDFFGGGYTVDAPTALWWKQLATAVVFGLGLATVLTLVVTPALLSVRVWVGRLLPALDNWRLFVLGGDAPQLRDAKLRARLRGLPPEDVEWTDPVDTEEAKPETEDDDEISRLPYIAQPGPTAPPHAAE